MKKALLLMALFAGSLLSANADDHLTALLKPGNAVLGIQLKNAAEYTAFQMDIKLPEGMTLDVAEGAEPVTAVTLERKNTTVPHKVFANLTSDGTLKVVAFSASSYDSGTTTNPTVITDGNKSFEGSKGDMLLIKVKTVENSKPSLIQVNNIEFVKTASLAADPDNPVGITAIGKLGDTNGDDTVDGIDVSKVIEHILGDSTLPAIQQERSNFTGEDALSGVDVSNMIDIILNY